MRMRGPDEDSKDARIELISSLKELIKSYQKSRELAASEIDYLEQRIKVLKTQNKLWEVSSAIMTMHLRRLGVKADGV